MKTNQLISLLQAADPSGELDVVMHGGASVYMVGAYPGYYDGAYEVLIRDPDNKYWNVCGAKITTRGKKVVLRGVTVEDALVECPDLPVKYDLTHGNYKKAVQKWRQEAIDIEKDLLSDKSLGEDELSHIMHNIENGEKYIRDGEDRTDEEFAKLVRQMRVKLGGKDEDLDF